MDVLGAEIGFYDKHKLMYFLAIKCVNPSEGRIEGWAHCCAYGNIGIRVNMCVDVWNGAFLVSGRWFSSAGVFLFGALMDMGSHSMIGTLHGRQIGVCGYNKRKGVEVY